MKSLFRRIPGAGLAIAALCAGFAAQAQSQNQQKLLLRDAEGAEQIRILDAVFGQDERLCRAVDSVARSCDRRSYCEVVADDRLCGDPYANVRKQLFVGYDCGDGRRSITVDEGEVARIYCYQSASEPVVDDSTGADPLSPPRNWRRSQVYVAFADYGAGGDRICDAAPAVSYECEGQSRCSVDASNDLCGDPARGTRKSLRVGYWCNGNLEEQEVNEGNSMTLACR